MIDRVGRLLWFGDYDGWGRLDGETNITGAHQPFRLQTQYCDAVKIKINFQMAQRLKILKLLLLIYHQEKGL